MRDREAPHDAARAPKGERRISRRDLSALVEAFAPLVTRVARKYEGRGAELDDLQQEGWLALIQIARATNKRRLVQALARTLPGRVRDAAARMRRAPGTLSLDEPASGAGGSGGSDDPDAPLIGETIADPRTGEEAARIERAAAIGVCLGGLTEAERATARALAEGRTYDEIAAETNATRQAVANRVRNMRRKLAALR